MTLTRRQALASIALSALALQTSFAADSPAISIYVKDMHCATCAKKIAKKLSGVPGVAQVKTHVKKGVAIVTLEKGKEVSPRALWEAVEAASFEPIRVASPLGDFQKKPLR